VNRKWVTAFPELSSGARAQTRGTTRQSEQYREDELEGKEKPRLTGASFAETEGFEIAPMAIGPTESA
jgi:hypothetical protein